MAAAAVLPGSGAFGVMLGELPDRGLDPTGVVLVLGQCLPLALRRTGPAACLAVVGAAFAIHQGFGYPATSAGLGLFLALYSAGAHLPRHRLVAIATATAAYLTLAFGLHTLGSPERAVDFVTFYPVLAVCWAAGAWARSRARGEAVSRALSNAQAVAQERNRIARELHDVVTHHVTAMVVQAEAAQFLLPPAREGVADALSAISDTGRQAMAELRSLLGVLAPSAEEGVAAATGNRSPVGRRVVDLVDTARAAGQSVTFVEGSREQRLPAGVELTVYRVVQEGLTNALKHASSRPTSVQVTYDSCAVEVVLRTAGPADAPAGGHLPVPLPFGGSAGSGRGLPGLQERVQLLGGQFLAGPDADGDFVVRALVPVEEDR